MDLYTQTAFASSRLLTNRYSSSFSLASRLFDKTDRQHIYNIYGLVRIADEIVDTYQGKDSLEQLDILEADTIAALQTGYSSNIIIHAFITTALAIHINASLIRPFFESMRIDANGQKTFTVNQYKAYIYGSAEVISLMCLKSFCQQSNQLYDSLSDGAKALGSVFQQVNFLRDIKDDYESRGRYYFPIATYESFDDTTKREIIADIRSQSKLAKKAMVKLAPRQRRAVGAAFNSYMVLLHKLEQTSAQELKLKRVRISNPHKLWLLLRSMVGSYEGVA
jgi:phytoene/squalene synthetase